MTNISNPVSPLVDLLESYSTNPTNEYLVPSVDTARMERFGITYIPYRRYVNGSIEAATHQVKTANFSGFRENQIIQIRNVANDCLRDINNQLKRCKQNNLASLEQAKNHLDDMLAGEGIGPSILRVPIEQSKTDIKDKEAKLEKSQKYVLALLDHKDLQLELPAKLPLHQRTLVKINDTAIKVFHAAVAVAVASVAIAGYQYLFATV